MLNHYHMANEPPPRDTLFSYLLTQELFEDAQEISVDRRVVSAGVVLAAIGMGCVHIDTCLRVPAVKARVNVNATLDPLEY